MKREDVLKMAVQLTAGELAGPAAMGVMMNGPSAVGHRITEYAEIIVNVARSSGVEVEES